MNKVVAIVPIRHNSQRVPGKNYRTLGDRPLYEYIINTLLMSNIDRIIVDTDSPNIIKGIKEKYVEMLKSDRIIISIRPVDLCDPKISMNDIIASVIYRLPEILTLNTIIFQTHVTNPFLTVETINKAITRFKELPNDVGYSMVSATRYQQRLWNKNGMPINHDPKELVQTQDLPILYQENSNFYIFRISTFYVGYNRISSDVVFYELDMFEAWDIDTEKEFRMAELIMEEKNKDEKLKGDELINKQLLNTLTTSLQMEINEYKLKGKTIRPTVMISAPYMMKDIETFKRFYEMMNVNVIVAEVEERLSAKDLIKYHKLYQVALIGDDGYNAETLSNCGAKALCKWGTGIDSIDVEYCLKNGIEVYNTPNAFSVPVAQSIMAAIFGFIRTTFASNEMMHNEKGSWVKLQGRTLEECTIGIIGLGNIGKHLVNYLRPYNCRILGNDIISEIRLEGVNHVSLEEVLSGSDVVCLCTTLNPTSNYIINSDTIKMMKKGAYLINMARGPLIEENCLIEAIEKGELGGAALDVFEREPLSEKSKFRELKNVIISSHNTNSSPKYWEKVHINTIRNSIKALNKL